MAVAICSAINFEGNNSMKDQTKCQLSPVFFWSFRAVLGIILRAPVFSERV